MESALLELAEQGSADDLVSVIVRLDPDRPVPAGLHLVARFGLIATARLRRADIERLRPAVASMKRPQDYTPAPLDEDDEAADDLAIRPTDQRRREGMPTGRGSIVCHLDWGLDFAHPAFRRPDGSTRLLALWDQAGIYDPAHPNRYGFGRIYTREEIDRALATADPRAALGYRWWSSDRGNGSHGTHTLGISCGRELDDMPAGFAPDADIVFVDLSTRAPGGPQPLGSSTDLLEGIDLADWIAADRNLAINASLGRQAGQHDGLTLTEQALDQFVSSRPGRAISMSCGNYYAKRAHASVTLLPGERRTLGLVLAPGERGSELDLWYPRVDRLAVSLTGPDGLVTAPVGPGERAALMHRGRRIARLFNRADDPNNGDHQVSLFFDGAAPAGEWHLTLIGEAVGDGRIHAWVERDPAGTSRLRFADEDVDPRVTVGTICNGFATIAVAAFDPHDALREPAPFSSSGPTRDGRSARPTVAAAGRNILSARSAPRSGGHAPLACRMSGTSMAAPAVTGLIALLYEAAPRSLWIEDIRALLVDTCEEVHEVLRERLGAGYVNPAAAIDAARALSPIPHPDRRWRLDPLTPRAQLRLPSREEGEMASPMDSEHQESTGYPAEYESEAGSPYECDADFEAADFEAEAFYGGESNFEYGGDRLEAGAEAEAYRSCGCPPADAEYAEGRRRGPPPLPFQIQLPVGGGGGGLGLAVPIGGRSSPFALSVPLGSTPAPAPAPPPPPAPVPAAAAPAAASQPAVPPPAPAATPEPAGAVAPEPQLVTALDLPPDPLAAATEYAASEGEIAEAQEFGIEQADFEADRAALEEAGRIAELQEQYSEASLAEIDAAYAGERLIHAAETSGEGAEGPGFLESVGESLAGAGEAEAAAEPPPSLYELFRRVAAGERELPDLLGRRCHVVARPGSSLGDRRPLRGDVMLRTFPGQRFVQLSFIADAQLLPLDRLAGAGLRPEGAYDPLPGRYVQVVELWPFRRRSDDRFARRLVNAADLVPPDTLLLRLLPRGLELATEAEQDDGSSQPLLTVGARGSAVASLQHRLNQLDQQRTAAGLPGLGNMPLAEDGVFGPRLRAAIQALQRLAPPGMVPDPNGAMTPGTWSALALLEASLSAVTPAALAAPAAPLQPSGGGVQAGQLTVMQVPLLAAHRGTRPDLVLRWNAMPAGTREVDVVVHLHGFSGHAEAMRIDRDKLPNSGLDFFNPANASERGRSSPTLAILPRGNYYGGASHMGYDFPALAPANALPQLIAIALERFGAETGLGEVRRGKLILTAHSGGGAGLMRLLASHDPDEIQTFDALYGPPAALIRWAEERLRTGRGASSSLRVLYREGEGTAAHSRQVRAAIAPLMTQDAAPRFRVEAVPVPHNDIPRRFGWRLLADAGADLNPRAAPSAHEAWSDFDAESEGEALLAEDAEAETPLPGLEQAMIDQLAAATFGNSTELQAYFASARTFQDWFNANLSGHPPFRRPSTRPGRPGSPLHALTNPAERRHFAEFWDRVQIGYDQPRISLLEFAALMAIILNETDGRFGNAAEGGGDPGGPHPGIAYFFDRIGRKSSYNAGNRLGNRTAGELFDDPLFIRVHGHLGGAERYARHGSDDNGVWHGQSYPAGAPNGMTSADAAFIREADFCKFRGRGVIQTTGREAYSKHVHYIRNYRGSDPDVLALKSAWSAYGTDDEVCTASTNAQWDAWFSRPDTLVLGLRFHAGPHGYQHMSRTAARLNEHATRHHAPNGSIATMGLKISGGESYANGLYRNRVLRLMEAMAALLGAGAAPHPVTPVTPPAPTPDPAPPAPAPSGRSPDLEPVHRERWRDPEPPQPQRPSGGHVRPRGPVAAPDAETARQQWEAHPRAHQYFNNSLERYLEFVPLFAHRGVANPAEYLAENMTTLSFLGHRSPGHRGLVAPLAQAERALAGRTLDPPLTSIWSLNVRKIAGTNSLSYHSLGQAFDVNPSSNPHVKAAADFLVIGAVCGIDLHREANPARLRAASAQFQRDFTPEWIAAQTDPQVSAALRTAATRQRLQGYARTGFCTLDQALIEALLGAGLRWGGAWTSSKDFMHFELP